MKKLQITALSSLAKVYEDKVFGSELSRIDVAKNQEFNFQIALFGEGNYTLEIESDIEGILAYRVGQVPVKMINYEGCDDGRYERTEPGNFPDVLFPLEDNKITLEGGKYSALWLCVQPSNTLNLPVGEHKIEIKLRRGRCVSARASVSVFVYDCALDPQELIFTQWLHNDCIASVHGVEVLSEAHWALIERYIALASAHGMNMLLTPVLTPPLDTEVGAERPTVQLVKITKNAESYEFDFSDLERYVKTATECGISYFEINHMFTQWGAEHAPKVIASVDGEGKRIFGWETDSTSEEYAQFLGALVPRIIECLEGLGISREQIYFHVSDEPGKDNLEKYSTVSRILEPLIKGCNQIDALSNLEFYRAGVVKTPVVATSHIEHFIEDNVPNPWCYYCCAQNNTVVNRFMAMPSARCRMIGTQMFKYDIAGFLQWGYNFYYTQLSKRRELDPYTENDAGGAFPAGDAFSVYPYKDGAIPSLRQKVFKEALNDHRLLSTLARVKGEAVAKALVDKIFGSDLTFKIYPIDEALYFALTKEALELITE